METEPKNESARLTRRGFSRLALGAVGTAVATTVPAILARADHHEAGTAPPTLVTDVEGNALLLNQVKYVPASEKPDQRCANCALLIAREGDYGKCGLFVEGNVPVTAWCTSWVQRRT